MKKLIALILALLLGLVSASSFFGAASNIGGVDIVPPGEGTLDCIQNGYVVTIQAGEESAPVPSFICHNGFTAPALLSIRPAHLPSDLGVKSIDPCCADAPCCTEDDPYYPGMYCADAPCSPKISGWNCLKFTVVYDATDIVPGTYPLVFEVSADVGFGQAVVISNFVVIVEVIPPPPPPS